MTDTPAQCQKTYHLVFEGRPLMVWCDREAAHEGDCGPFCSPPAPSPLAGITSPHDRYEEGYAAGFVAAHRYHTEGNDAPQPTPSPQTHEPNEQEQ